MRDDFLAKQSEISDELYKLSVWTIGKIESVMPIEKLPNLTKEEITELIIKLKPTGIKSVTNYLYIIGLYDRYVGNEYAHKMVLELDRNEIFSQCQKINPVKKFVSNREFNDLIFNIEMYEEYNTLYYTSLLSCIYEGIYSDDMSVIKNLRASDIHGNIVTLREDNGHVYDLEISSNLAEQLIELSKIDTWERRNRSGQFEIKVYGLYVDSCFKIEQRNSGTNYRFSYFSRIRKISKEYMDYPIRPLYLYISGIMYRIRLGVEEYGFDLKYAFVDNKKFPLTSGIIKKELERSNYNCESKYLRQIVNGFIDVFDE